MFHFFSKYFLWLKTNYISYFICIIMSMKYIKNIDKSKNDIVKIDMVHGKANTVGSICKIINVSCSSLLTVFF